MKYLVTTSFAVLAMIATAVHAADAPIVVPADAAKAQAKVVKAPKIAPAHAPQCVYNIYDHVVGCDPDPRIRGQLYSDIGLADGS